MARQCLITIRDSGSVSAADHLDRSGQSIALIPWSASDQLDLLFLRSVHWAPHCAIAPTAELPQGGWELVLSSPRLLATYLIHHLQFANIRMGTGALPNEKPDDPNCSAPDIEPVRVRLRRCRRKQWHHSYAARTWKQVIQRRRRERFWNRQLPRLVLCCFSRKKVGQQLLDSAHAAGVLRLWSRWLASLTASKKSGQRLWKKAKSWRTHHRLRVLSPGPAVPDRPVAIAAPEPAPAAKSPSSGPTPIDNGIAGLSHISQTTAFDQALQVAKMQSLRELAYGASHEINNPLANIAMRAQALIRSEPVAERKQKLQAIYLQAMRAHEMISDLMLFAHPPTPVLAKFALRELVQEILPTLRSQCQQNEILISDESRIDSHDTWVSADRVMLREAILAVFKNAIEAVSAGGKIRWSLAAHANDRVTLSIIDSGLGIPESVRAKIFDPFYSGREAGRGLGFGLSKAWRILQLHDGTIECVRSKPGETCFELTLPASSTQIPSGQLSPEVTALPSENVQV